MPKSEQGVRQDRYQVIPRTLIFITRGEQVLLLKGAPTKRLWANRYNGIGGHIEKGEDVLSAARRELREESGLEISDLWLCGTIIVDADDRIGIAIYVFKGEYEGGEPVASNEGSLEWIDMQALNTLPLVEDLTVLLPDIITRRPVQGAFSARTYYDEADRMQIVIQR
jgi:8-oxo-dGTP diphosphatase